MTCFQNVIPIRALPDMPASSKRMVGHTPANVCLATRVRSVQKSMNASQIRALEAHVQMLSIRFHALVRMAFPAHYVMWIFRVLAARTPVTTPLFVMKDQQRATSALVSIIIMYNVFFSWR